VTTTGSTRCYSKVSVNFTLIFSLPVERFELTLIFCLRSSYWIWIYWLNIFAWALRGLAVNEFDSGKYDGPSEVPGMTIGDVILSRFGFVDGNEDPYTFEWAWWSVIYSLGVSLMAIVASTVFLGVVRFATGKSLSTDSDDDSEEAEPPEIIQLPFQKVNLTFKNIHYTVTSSVGNEKIKLLKGIDGIVEAGKMTALVSIVSL
jgi:hypothetical protein